MKTITNGVKTEIVSDEEAIKRVEESGWMYCPQMTWKTLLRSNNTSSGIAVGSDKPADTAQIVIPSSWRARRALR